MVLENMTVEKAIEQSIVKDKIIDIRNYPNCINELLALCEVSVHGGGTLEDPIHEFSGYKGDNSWNVNVHMAIPKTLNVGQLIKSLKKYPPEMRVVRPIQCGNESLLADITETADIPIILNVNGREGYHQEDWDVQDEMAVIVF